MLATLPPYDAAAWSPDVAPFTDPSLVYRALIQDVIGQTAAAGDAVIVAHGASILLARMPGVLRVLVTASPGVRAERIAAERGCGAKEATRRGGPMHGVRSVVSQLPPGDVVTADARHLAHARGAGAELRQAQQPAQEGGNVALLVLAEGEVQDAVATVPTSPMPKPLVDGDEGGRAQPAQN